MTSKTKKKRQRNVDLFVCPNCHSPFVRGRTECNSISGLYTIHIDCLNCNWLQKQQANNHFDVNDRYQEMIKDKFVKFKSPIFTEMKFRSIKVDRKSLSKSALGGTNVLTKYGMPPFFAFCEDVFDSKLIYRFSGESARRIIYETVQHKPFRTHICIQKFWKMGQEGKIWTGPPGVIMNFRQSPKIVGEIELQL